MHHHSAVDWMGEEGRQVVTGDIVFQDPDSPGAFLFSVCQQWYPQSFIAFANAQEPRSWLELLFLSFATLSGVGMTDVLPISAPARVLVALEMFAGVMYLTMVVTRLLGMAGTSHKMKR